jgi:hypothetical protein
MMKVHDLVAGLARAGKTANEIKIITDIAFGNKTAIYNIIKKVEASETTDNQQHLNEKKR